MVAMFVLFTMATAGWQLN